MNLAQRRRIGLAAAIAICAATSIAAATTVSAGPPVRLPDLKTIKPSGPSLSLGKTGGGRPVLHLSNRIVNAGEGPLELFAGEPTQACADQGQYDIGEDLEAEQVLFQDDGSGGVEPGGDETVGCFEFHPVHNHWHLQDISQYKLADKKTDELVAGPSRKIGFCILDGDRARPGLPGSPALASYASQGCNFGDAENGPSRMGLSVGWADTYSYFTPGQKLPLPRSLPKGIYCLVSTANPPDGPSEIIESDAENNSRRKLVAINLKKGEAEPGPGRCR